MDRRGAELSIRTSVSLGPAFLEAGQTERRPAYPSAGAQQHGRIWPHRTSSPPRRPHPCRRCRAGIATTLSGTWRGERSCLMAATIRARNGSSRVAPSAMTTNNGMKYSPRAKSAGTTSAPAVHFLSVDFDCADPGTCRRIVNGPARRSVRRPAWSGRVRRLPPRRSRGLGSRRRARPEDGGRCLPCGHRHEGVHPLFAPRGLVGRQHALRDFGEQALDDAVQQVGFVPHMPKERHGRDF